MKDAFLAPAPVISWAIISAILAISGPLGSYGALPFGARAIFWSIAVAVSIICGMTVRLVVQRLMRGAGFWIISVVAVTVTVLLLSGPLLLFTEYMESDERAWAPGLPQIMVMIFLFGMGVSAFRWLLLRSQTPEETPKPPRLLQRVEPDLRGRLIRCTAVDHYVSVWTDKGEARVLMRFSDAIDELGGADGLRVHRSHWVATDAVAGHSTDKGRVFLELEDGSQVPVSRNFRPKVEALGLL
ncbi:MAG: LytTR family DNA-binding domain-containing protein [Paracoccaceae bacterium]